MREYRVGLIAAELQEAGRVALEGKQAADLGSKRVGNAGQVVDADPDASGLDAPDVGLAAADHQGKPLLRKPLAFPACSNGFAQGESFLIDIHALSVCASIYFMAS